MRLIYIDSIQMNSKRLALGFCVLLFIVQSALSQIIENGPITENISFTRYGTEEGLSQSSVSSLVTDHEGYIWIGTQDGLNRFDGYEFKVFRSDSDDPNSLRSNYITDLLVDASDNLWIGTVDGGLNHLDKSRGLFTSYDYDLHESDKVTNNSTTDLEIDHLGNIWIGTLNGLQKFSSAEKRFVNIKNQIPIDLSNNRIISLLVDSNNRLWVSTFNELYVYQISANNLQTIENIQLDLFETNNRPGFISEDNDGNILLSNKRSLYKYNSVKNEFNRLDINLKDNNRIISSYTDRKGNYWITTANKLYHLQESDKGYTLSSFDEMNFDPTSINTGAYLTRVIDDNIGNIWIGSWAGGLNRMNDAPERMKDIRVHPFIENASRDIVVTGLYIDEQSKIWMGTWGAGVYQLHLEQDHDGLYINIDSTMYSISASAVRHIAEDNSDNIWVSTHGSGLHKLNKKTGSLLSNWVTKEYPQSGLSENILCTLMDSDDKLWASTFQHGLIRINEEEETFRFFLHDENNPNSISSNWPRHIYEDSQKRIWITTSGGGLNLYNRESNNFQRFIHDANDPSSIPNNIVNTIIEATDGILWVGTYTGIAKLVDAEKGIFKRYQPEDKSANNVICAIEEDDQQRLWLSTFNGITCFDMRAERFVNYDLSGGTSHQEFNTLTSAKDPNTGEIFFGGQTTCTYFQPNDFSVDTSSPNIVVTKMVVHNAGNERAAKKEVLFANSNRDYEFSYQDKILSFEIAGLSFQKTNRQEYQYQLLGFSDQWYQLGNSREIVFTNLDPGSYNLSAKVSNSDGYWSESQSLLTFSVNPPWYQTAWAYALFIGLISAGVYFLYRFQLSKNIAQQEAGRLKELDEFKTRFYSNITHEFRTPLTVISGMAQELGNNLNKDPNKKINLIQKNSQNLLALVNQMLDLSKLQAGKISSQVLQRDIIIFLKYLTESHQSYAKLKNIGLQFYSEENELILDFDAGQMEQVLNNLISNSVKFTKEYGNILIIAKKVKANKKTELEIKVKDNGIGISKEQLPYIFDRFHQANPIHGNQGSGIGLALVKELMGFMNGEITVDSELHTGTTFYLRFPITNTAPLSNPLSIERTVKPAIAISNDHVDSEEVDCDLPLLLIIEDNPDVTYYLRTCLEANYRIVTSINGKLGLESAIETLPDIIISDVMMPVMDGFEVCERLKKDERTNHIPVILLTAKATSEDKLAGLSHGADAYLIKPFKKEELVIRMENLMEIRRTLQVKYSSSLLSSQEAEKVPLSKEEIFVKRLEEVILARLDDENFSIHDLSRELMLSRSQTHRKIKALTGMSTAIYIRHVRLQKAKELLLSTDLPISEIAYQVGFKTLTYFSQVFKETFGESPSATRT